MVPDGTAPGFKKEMIDDGKIPGYLPGFLSKKETPGMAAQRRIFMPVFVNIIVAIHLSGCLNHLFSIYLQDKIENALQDKIEITLQNKIVTGCRGRLLASDLEHE